MGKKWMPITAGVLGVVYGVGGIAVGCAFIMITRWVGPDPDLMVSEITGWLLIILGGSAIIGGIFAIRRDVWPMALIGAILSLAPSVPYMYSFWLSDFNPDNFFDISTLLGFSGIPAIVAIILTVLSRKQFERK